MLISKEMVTQTTEYLYNGVQCRHKKYIDVYTEPEKMPKIDC